VKADQAKQGVLPDESDDADERYHAYQQSQQQAYGVGEAAGEQPSLSRSCPPGAATPVARGAPEPRGTRSRIRVNTEGRELNLSGRANSQPDSD
jgi:hypothetical protein